MAQDVHEMIETTLATLARDLEALDAVSKRAIAAEKRSKKYDIKLGSNIAWIATQRAAVLTELRQLEKHDRVQAKNPAERQRLICEYARRATPEQRGEIMAALVEADQGRSVLS